jgi:hypothetical protein
MHVTAVNHTHFLLRDHTGQTLGELLYEKGAGREASLLAGNTTAILQYENTGRWTSFIPDQSRQKKMAEIRMRAGGQIVLHFVPKRKRYRFIRTGGFKARFVLLTKQGEELMGLLPEINWKNKAHEFKIQLNEELGEECSVLLILHVIHCACYYLGMLNGSLPALVNI